MLTKNQQKIYQFIQQYINNNDYSPSLTEIAVGIGISPNSISLISRNIHALVEAGWLKFGKKGYRNLQIASNHQALLLPVVGRIAAGTPIEAIEDNQVLDLGDVFGKGHFLLRVKGDSMIEDGILDGDFVICKPAEQAQENEIVVALIDQQEATLKRLSYKIKDRITLIPANPHLKPKAYLSHRVQIQGVFVGLLRLKN